MIVSEMSRPSSRNAAFASMTASGMFQAEASPRGLQWPRIDPDDTEALARMHAIAPYFRTMVATEGAVAGTTEGGIPTAGYPYPAMISLADQDEDLVYNFTKAMYETFPDYKGTAPGIDAWKAYQAYIKREVQDMGDRIDESLGLGPKAAQQVLAGADEAYIEPIDYAELRREVVRAALGPLPHYSRSQYSVTRRVPLSQAQAGDLVFYFKRGTHHVGLYIGNGKMVHAANPRSGVVVSNILGPWYSSRFSGIGRVVR